MAGARSSTIAATPAAATSVATPIALRERGLWRNASRREARQSKAKGHKAESLHGCAISIRLHAPS
jgi:hypothetical protein